MTAEALQMLANPGYGWRASREILDLLPAAVYITDAEGLLTYANDAAIRLAGRALKPGVDRWFITAKHFRPNGSPVRQDECCLAVALKGGELVAGDEFIGERPDGTRFRFLAYPALLRDAAGSVTGGMNVLVELNSGQGELEDSDYKALLLSAIVDSSDDAIISKNLDGTITSWNKSAERLFGYTADEIVGRSVTTLIPQDRLQEEPRIIESLKRGERVEHFETIRRRKDGKLLDISLTISPVRDKRGNIIGASKMARDTTETKRVERSARLLSAIVDSSDDAIVSKDLDGTITSWNKSAERLFGYKAEEIIGQSVTVLIPPDRQQEEPKIIERLKSGERVDHFETIRRRKDGTLLEISLTISPVRDGQGRIVGASKIARDITERRRVEAEIRRVNQGLEQFAFSASHDLQEPLRSIKIYSELLIRRYSSKLDAEGLEFLGYLRTGAMRMESLVADLLAYTQISKAEQQHEIVDPNAILKTVLESLAGAISEGQARITSEPLPPLPIYGRHLQSLLQNLIGNAIKYRSKERIPEIHVRADLQGTDWVFSVSDNGIGLAPQYKENIFGLFQRLHTSEEYPGTGMGLAICQRIVAQYHGQIWVESEPGRGSTFRFSIPAQADQVG